MRLHFQLTPNTRTVPFNYQHFLTGAFHKWLGNKIFHDGISLYSLSWLHGGVTMREGRRIEGGLDIPRGARWFISAHDETLLVAPQRTRNHLHRLIGQTQRRLLP